MLCAERSEGLGVMRTVMGVVRGRQRRVWFKLGSDWCGVKREVMILV